MGDIPTNIAALVTFILGGLATGVVKLFTYQQSQITAADARTAAVQAKLEALQDKFLEEIRNNRDASQKRLDTDGRIAKGIEEMNVVAVKLAETTATAAAVAASAGVKA